MDFVSPPAGRRRPFSEIQDADSDVAAQRPRRVQFMEPDNDSGCQPGPLSRLVNGCQPRPPIKIGTDCSGLDVPVAMLQEIFQGRNRQVRHVFSSEIDPKTLQILLMNFSPEHHYKDLTRRANHRGQGEQKSYPASDELPKLDIYAAGFPCQSFSSAGQSGGVKDARGAVWLPIFRFIAIALPRAVVLENVMGLTRGKHKHTFDTMMSLLNSMDEYEWHSRCLNTKDFGVPQNRPRIFIVGIKKADSQKTFTWPAKAAASQLDDFLDDDVPLDEIVSSLPKPGIKKRTNVLSAIEKMLDRGLNPLTTPATCSANNRVCQLMLNCTPCLTKARAAGHGHWLIHRGRDMSTREMFKLQGLNPDRWVRPEAVSERHFRSCAGNAMSGNVTKAVLLSVLAALGEL